MAASAAVTVVDAVAKYFFFICLDQQLSFAASLKVLAELKRHNRLDDEHRADWVSALHRWRGKVHRLRPRPWTAGDGDAKGFLLPEDFELAIWVSFLAAADPIEVEAVLFSRILGFTDPEIARGLGVTEGTVRYRVGRALRHLGGFNES
jgi:hypothetical protein